MCCRIAVELVLWLFYSTFDCHSTAFVLLILQPILHMLIPQPFNCSFYDQFHNNCTAYSKTNSTATQRTFYSYYTAILELILLPSYMSFYCTFYCLFLINSTAILQLILLPIYCHCTIPQSFYSSFYCHFTYHSYSPFYCLFTKQYYTAHSTAILQPFYNLSTEYLRIILYTAILLPFYCHSTAILQTFDNQFYCHSTTISQPFHSHSTANSTAALHVILLPILPQPILWLFYSTFYCICTYFLFYNQFYSYSSFYCHSTTMIYCSFHNQFYSHRMTCCDNFITCRQFHNMSFYCHSTCHSIAHSSTNIFMAILRYILLPFYSICTSYSTTNSTAILQLL